MMDKTMYFAYGSNINLDQMASRCPDAEVVGPAVLENYELLFRGRAGGSGVATIEPREGARVHGLLWRITPGCEQSLDLYEGYPRLYEKQTVTVRDGAGQEFTVMAYVMTDSERWRDPAMPSGFYYKSIREGFQQNNLPLRALSQARKHCQEEIAAQTDRSPGKTGHRGCRSERKGGQKHER